VAAPFPVADEGFDLSNAGVVRAAECFPENGEGAAKRQTGSVEMRMN